VAEVYDSNAGSVLDLGMKRGGDSGVSGLATVTEGLR